MTDAWATARAIAGGSLSASEAVGRALAAIEARDGEINAFTAVRPEAARGLREWSPSSIQAMRIDGERR